MSSERKTINEGFAEMFKNGVIMDVSNPEQAKIAENAGACAVMALEKVPSEIRKAGGVARMSDPSMIRSIMDAVSIPVMAKCRIGHIAEARILEALEIDFIDESEVLTPADDQLHLDKQAYSVPFVCGARNLGEALRRINEGAAMIRTKGEAGTGNIVEAVRHARQIRHEIDALAGMDRNELQKTAAGYRVPLELLLKTAEQKRLPVVNFAAGGVASPADAALMMMLGSDGVFVGSGIFTSEKPEKMAQAVVEAVIHYQDPLKLAELSSDLGKQMKGIEISKLETAMAGR